jgi:hypothetical protein
MLEEAGGAGVEGEVREVSLMLKSEFVPSVWITVTIRIYIFEILKMNNALITKLSKHRLYILSLVITELFLLSHSEVRFYKYFYWKF